MMKTLFAAAGALALTAAAFAQDDEIAAWNADLDAVIATFETHHPNPYWLTPEAEFDAAAQAWREALPEMTRAQRIAGLARIIALVGDGHSWMPMQDVPHGDQAFGPGFRSLPVRFEWFEDGIFIVGATETHARMLGSKLEAIGGVPAEAALARVMELLPQDAVNWSAELAPEWLMQAELLAALGLAEDAERIELTISHPGFRGTIGLEPLPAGWRYDWINSMDGGPAGPDGPAAWRDLSEQRPAFLAPGEGLRRFVPETGYLQLYGIGDGEERFAEAGTALAAAGEALGSPRVILDLRRCQGGDGSLNSGFVDALASSEALNRPGGIIVLTSRQTHSAAVMLVSELEQRTEAVFIGQNTADRPNHYGETNFSGTPNSGLIFIYSSLYWQTSAPDDTRRWRTPDVAIPYRFSDYAAGRDPVLEAALNY